MHTPRRSLIFHVRPRTTNVGNELIAMGTTGLLRAAWPDEVDTVSVPSAGPAGAGLSARNMYEANQLADAVLVGGGNLFENGALDVDPTALGALAVPLGLLAVSSGRVYGREGRLVSRTDGLSPQRIQAVCAQADPLLVRDGATAEFLAGLGVEDAVVAGCPTLCLDRFVSDLPPPDPELAGTALVSLRHPRLMSVPHPDQARTYTDVARLVDGLSRSFDRVALLCHDVQDLAFAASFDAVASYYTEDPRRLVGWLRGCAVSTGYRLHAFLTAIALGTAAVHISYDERGEAMIDTLGAHDHEVRLRDTDDVAGEVVDRVAAHGGRSPRADIEPRLLELGDALVAGIATLGARARATAGATTR